MKIINFFLISLLFANGCQKQEEEDLDLDQMVLAEDEFDSSHLAGEPIDSPQEILIKEPTLEFIE